MNQQEAVAKFVETYIKELTSDNLTAQKLKSMEREFFTVQNRNKVQRPTTREVLMALKKLMEKRGVDINKVGDYIADLPIFGLAGESFRDTLFASILAEPPEVSIRPEDIETIKKVGIFEAVSLSKGREIEAQKLQELEGYNALIELKKEEYDNLPSVLDQEDIPEPEFDQMDRETGRRSALVAANDSLTSLEAACSHFRPTQSGVLDRLFTLNWEFSFLGLAESSAKDLARNRIRAKGSNLERGTLVFESWNTQGASHLETFSSPSDH